MSEQATQQQPSPDEQPQEKAQEQRQPQQQSRGERGGSGGGRGGRRRHGGQHQPQPQQQSGQQSRRPDPSLNMDELRDLVQLIAEHGFTDFELEREGFRVRLRRELAPQAQAAQGVQPQAGASTTAGQASMSAEPRGTTASAPMQPTPPPQTATNHPGAEAEAAASEDEGLYIITSPIVGTFYRTPSPTSEPFVRIGSHVEADSVVCIIEAMKLMNEIQSETTGEVVKIYVENGQPVEYGQPLFGIKQ
jgi:acetyl-CoA carboxylase biotin carboxyl carrier protein